MPLKLFITVGLIERFGENTVEFSFVVGDDTIECPLWVDENIVTEDISSCVGKYNVGYSFCVWKITVDCPFCVDENTVAVAVSFSVE